MRSHCGFNLENRLPTPYMTQKAQNLITQGFIIMRYYLDFHELNITNDSYIFISMILTTPKGHGLEAAQISAHMIPVILELMME